MREMKKGLKGATKAEDAYGKRDESVIRKFPPTILPKDLKPEKGMTIRLHNRSGKPMPGTIVDTKENCIVIDLNHPLAGKDLTFDIKVVGID